ncbi:MAG: histidine kinase, partial [Tannerella sp.]|nr:histidine kinase [Tannerella sp.]
LLLVSTVPIIIISAVLYIIAGRTIENSSRQFVSLYLSEVGLSIDNFEKEYELATRMVLGEVEVLNILRGGKAAQMDLLIENKNTMSSFFQNLSENYPSIQAIMLVDNDENLYSWLMGGSQINGGLLLRQEWFREIIENQTSPFFISPTHSKAYYANDRENECITVGRKLWDYSGTSIGFLFLDIRPDTMITLNDDFRKLGSEYAVRLSVTNQKKEVVYDSDTAMARNSSEPVSASHVSGKLLILNEMSKSGRLLIDIRIPLNKLLAPLNNIYFSAVIFVFAWITTIVFLLSKINKLQKNVYILDIKQKEARWQMLRAQINPHMFYNTLESIRMHALINNQDKIARMTKALARMFRHSLVQESEVSNNCIRDELNHAEDYVYIQNVRFDNICILEERLSESIKKTPVMPMIFQPLIENSIQHGLRDRKTPLHILIEEELISPEKIKISVTDDGLGMDEDLLVELNDELSDKKQRKKTPRMNTTESVDADVSGIGLRNIAERLRLHYGREFCLHISSEEGKWFRVEFCLPVKNDNNKET